MTAAEKIKNRIEKLEEKLFEEKLNSHRKINNLGWGYGMRCVKMPTFTKEDRIEKRIEELKIKLEYL